MVGVCLMWLRRQSAMVTDEFDSNFDDRRGEEDQMGSKEQLTSKREAVRHGHESEHVMSIIMSRSSHKPS